MASSINSFFVNIGKSVDQKIPQSNKRFSDFLGDMNPYCITLNTCTDAEIRELVFGVNWSKASGPFSIPSNIIKSFKDVFYEPLSAIVNKSLSEGIFPDLLKFATVHPIYKKATKLNVQITAQFPFFLILAKFLREPCIIESNFF